MEYSFWDRFIAGIETIKEGFKVLFKHPVFFIPIILGVVLLIAFFVAAFLGMFHFLPNLSKLPRDEFAILMLKFSFVLIFGSCVIYSIVSFLQLEFIEQLETDKKFSFINALCQTLFKDLFKGLPIILVWTCICFLLSMLRGKNRRNNFMIKAILGEAIDLLDRGTRMVVFMIFPAIAWEDKNPIAAAKKGWNILKNNIAEFTLGVIQIEAMAAIIGIPVAIFAAVLRIYRHSVSDTTLILLMISFIVYVILVGYICMYIEQMYAASLYMWYVKWEKAVVKASVNNEYMPKLQEIPKPSLLDNVPDLL